MSEHHILVIDDDERLRTLLRRFLEESGFRVTVAGNASEARQILAGIEFDLLVVDIMMPGETGLEFLTDIREDNAVPALFLTAMSDAENRIEGLEAGADDYIPKPFEPRELVLRIKRILQRNRTNKPNTNEIAFGPYQFNPNTGMLSKLVSEFILLQLSNSCLPALANSLTRFFHAMISVLNWTDEWKDAQLTLPLRGFVAN